MGNPMCNIILNLVRKIPGGIIVLDDYRSNEKQKEAHDQFAKLVGVKILSLPTPTANGIIIKP